MISLKGFFLYALKKTLFKNFKIKSGLTEKQVESDVATYLSWISPPGRLPYRLLDIDEQLTGADKKLDLVMPVYMQFKVSHGLKPLNSVISSFLPNTPLQMIRKYRRDRDFSDTPTLYFKLRDLASNATDFQHNILLKLRSINSVHAFYVAPLSLDRDDYFKLLCGSAVRTMEDPFLHRSMAIHDASWVSYIGMIPFLRAHVSIPPMEKVSHSDHYYSFSQTGDEIVFHSPSEVSGIHRLSDELKIIVKSIINNPYVWLNTNEYVYQLYEAFSLPNDQDSNRLPLERLQQFGHYLYQTFDIRQFLFLSSKELLSIR